MPDVFSALADPIRRRLLDRLLAGGGQTIRQVGAPEAISRQALAKHLKILEAAGLVVVKRVGREKLHFIRTAPLTALTDRWMSRSQGAALEGSSGASSEPKPPGRRRKRRLRSHLAKRERRLKEMELDELQEQERNLRLPVSDLRTRH